MRISAGVEMLQLTARAFDQDIIIYEKNQMKISSYMLMNLISRILKGNFRLLKRMRVE
jgi:hypothetical protein